MKNLNAFLLLTSILFIQNGHAARILGLFAHPARSNSIFVHAVMTTLSQAGHNVTVYSTIKPPENSGFHHVHIVTDNTGGSSLSKFSYEKFINTLMTNGFANRLLRKIAHQKTESFLRHPLMQTLLKSNESFDLVVTSAVFGEQSLLVFGHKFKAPTISLHPMGTGSAVDYMLGNALSLTFSPDALAFTFTDKMSLFERVQNVLSGTASLVMNHWYDIPGHDAILQRHASSLSPPPPPVYQMVRDIALTFVNVHPSISYPKPIPPNIVLIGGIHIDEDSAPLPQDIQELMDNSSEGVVFCSLGSIVPIDSMPENLIHAFLNAFGKLPQKVIWKVSKSTLPSLPKNVVVSSWLPQQKILEHPNLKLFFTHGGLGSQLEVLRAGVPLVGLPFIADQPSNVKLFEVLGVGVGLQLDTLSEETISSALDTVLSNNSYAENARRVARIYADRLIGPKDLVVYWTNYLLKHGGTHLRPQAALMPWYQRYLLDVTVVLLLVFAIILVISIKLVKIIMRNLFAYITKEFKIKYKLT